MKCPSNHNQKTQRDHHFGDFCSPHTRSLKKISKNKHADTQNIMTAKHYIYVFLALKANLISR